MLEEGIEARLYADANVVACLYDNSSIYPVVLPQDAQLPALTYRRISAVDEPFFESQPQLRLWRVRMEFEAWSNVYGETKKLKKAVLDSLLDFSGTLPDADQTVVRDVVHDTESDELSEVSRNFYNKFDVFITCLE
jgi:hypothetical protein